MSWQENESHPSHQSIAVKVLELAKEEGKKSAIKNNIHFKDWKIPSSDQIHKILTEPQENTPKQINGKVPAAEQLQKVWEGTHYLDEELINQSLEVARLSKNCKGRGRFILRIHPGDTPEKKQELHLMINAITERNYVGPHVHTESVKNETFRVLKGEALVVIFEDEKKAPGEIKKVIKLSAHPDGRKTCTIRHGTMHTIIATSDFAMLEGKFQPPGGYNKDTDKNFAPWAPKEGEAGAEEYFSALETRARQWLAQHKPASTTS